MRYSPIEALGADGKEQQLDDGMGKEQYCDCVRRQLIHLVRILGHIGSQAQIVDDDEKRMDTRVHLTQERCHSRII